MVQVAEPTWRANREVLPALARARLAGCPGSALTSSRSDA
jgi:hypothetical protein